MKVHSQDQTPGRPKGGNCNRGQGCLFLLCLHRLWVIVRAVSDWVCFQSSKGLLPVQREVCQNCHGSLPQLGGGQNPQCKCIINIINRLLQDLGYRESACGSTGDFPSCLEFFSCLLPFFYQSESTCSLFISTYRNTER